jgi:hypothetical protein
MERADLRPALVLTKPLLAATARPKINRMNTYDKKPAESKPSWRDVLPVHPAAEMFPLMSRDELIELGEDIKKNKLRIPLIFWRSKDGVDSVLDGRNRLDAGEAVGMEWSIDELLKTGHYYLEGTHDPYAIVISLNIHRRHLTGEQKRDLIAKLLKVQPEKSDRAIAKSVGSDHKTVAAVRKSNGEIPHKDRTEATGRKARGRKPESERVSEPAKATPCPCPSCDIPLEEHDAAEVTSKATPAEELAEQQIDNVCANADFSLPPGMPPISSTNEPVDADDLGQALNMLLNRPEPMPSFIHAALVAHANNLITRGAPDDWIACAKQVLTALASGRTGVLPFQ